MIEPKEVDDVKLFVQARVRSDGPPPIAIPLTNGQNCCDYQVVGTLSTTMMDYQVGIF